MPSTELRLRRHLLPHVYGTLPRPASSGDGNVDGRQQTPERGRNGPEQDSGANPAP